MKKNIKKDLVNILILIIAFFIVYFALTRFTFLFGSSKDWNQQHWIIPEYFRNLFYKNHDLFPDFAFNLGGGQNIYNLSYYGFLSPIILFSYLLPFITMRNYIIISSIFMLLLSVIMMYFFIKKKSNSNIALISSFVFLMATPLIFHAKRHIMFINYFPFLLLSYIAVDKYFENDNKWLLTLSIFLMIMTSYLFSVGGILSVIIYGIYCYIKNREKIKLLSFIGDGIKFLIPILIAILMASILIGPTFYSLLNGRDVASSIDLISLFKPRLNLKNILYSSYSLGLSSIALFGLVHGLFSKKKENIFLSLCLFVILLFPIFIYLLNGGLYVESKVLIPFIPLLIMMISNFLKDLMTKKVNINIILMAVLLICSISLFFNNFSYIKYLFIDILIVSISLLMLVKKKTFKYFYILLFPMLIIFSIAFNRGDSLVELADRDENNAIIDEIRDLDKSFYRVNIYDKNLNTVDHIYDLDYYTATMYSSSASKNYEDFYYNRIGNEVIFRTYRMMTNTNNLFYNIYMGNKYVVSENFNSGIYHNVFDSIYRYNRVLPIGYATNKLMSVSDYDELEYPDNIYALVNYTIVDDKNIVSNYNSPFEKIDLNYEVLDSDVEIARDNSSYKIHSDKNNSKIKLRVNNDLNNRVLLLSFDMNYQEKCSVGDTYIDINGIKNKLTCRGWKYNNKNYNFKYILHDKDLSNLKIAFSKGDFDISNFKFYTIDYRDIYKLNSSINPFIISENNTKGDKIYGSINVLNDGYFNLSIPYDKGFNILVDGKEIEYEKVDLDFIGFRIEKGHHDITIEYSSPFKNISMVISIIGIILFILEVFMVSLTNMLGSILNELKDPKTKLFKFIMGIYKKNKEVFNYLVVGVLTTLVNLIIKWLLLFTVLDATEALELQIAVVISWIGAVLFAYVTNRLFVFYSKNKNIIEEMLKFFGARLLTLILEMGIMWFFVNFLALNSDLWVIIWTIITQVLVIVLNYIFSKLLVFVKK